MADVSVEFGAKDTGLEATLKTVQAEMSRLETEIKSGELSFNELTSAMSQLAKAEKVSKQLQSIGGAAAGASPQVDKLGKDGKEMGDNVKKGSDKGGMSLGELAKASGVAGAAFAAGMAVFNTAMKGVQEVAASFGKALDLGGQLADLSAQTGVAAGELLVLQRAFDNTGAGAEKVSPAITQMSSLIVDAMSGTGAAAKAFDQLSLSAEALINLPAEQQFQKIGTALAGVANETQRSALASNLFGGELGKDLLPLMTDFAGETRTASQQLGSMVDVMNENSAAFDSIGDGIKVAQGKFTEFAAGLMSVMTPAIEAVVTALTRIDAAQIGKDLGAAFVGAGEAMKGFQSAIDAFDAGDMSLALKAIFESVKLQAMETANSAYKNLTSAFQTAGDFIATMFAPSGALVTTIVSAFEFIGNKASASMMRTLAAGFAGNQLTEGIALSLNTAANEANKTANEIEASLSGAATRIADQFAKAGLALPENFAKHQAALTAGFINTEEQAKKVAALQEEINTATGTADTKILNATNNSATLTNNFGKAATNAGAAQTATENAAKAASKLEQSFAAAMGSAHTYEMSTLGAEAALARGAREMTSEQFSAGLKEVKTDLRDIGGEYANLANSGAGIKKIAESLGLDTEEKNPKRLLLEVQQELVKIGNTPVVIGITFNEEAFKAQITSLYDSANTTFANPIAANLDGDQSIVAVRDSAEGNFVAPMEINLDGDSTIQDVRDAAETKFANPIDLTMSGSQAANDVFDTVKSAFDAPVTLGVDADLTTATPEVAALGDPQTFTLSADTAQAAADISNAVGSLNSNITTQTDDNNIASTRATIEQGVAGIPLTFTVDPEAIKESIGTIDISGGAGGGVMGEIKTLVDTIKGFVEKIEGKLPMTALA